MNLARGIDATTCETGSAINAPAFVRDRVGPVANLVLEAPPSATLQD